MPRWLAGGVGLAIVAVFLHHAAPARAAVLPAGFEEVTLADGLTAPTAVAWTPDGRMLIAEKAGRVRVVAPDGRLLPKPLVDISDHVNSLQDRGLLGLAVDSAFASNHYVYLLYTYEDDPYSREGPKVSRLTRLVVREDSTVADPESPESVVLGRVASAPCPSPDNTVDCIPSDAPDHSIGTVRSGPDGTLWVGSGDAAWPNTVDELAFRSYDERSYAGKIVHVDRQGQGLPGHPFCPSDADLSHVCTKLYAKGFRNPYRFTLGAAAGPLAGDVGWNTREEIDVVEPGRDYGWPCYEGTIRTPGYGDHPRCADEYALEGTAEAAAGPAYDYPHAGGGAVVVGPRYSGDQYPEAFVGDIFFGDYVQSFVRRLRLGEGAVEPKDFAGEAGGAVDLEAAPDGDLVYVYFGDGSKGSGSVRRIRYAPHNRTPIPRVRARPTWGAAPLTVDFDAGDSTDPDGDTLTYDWDFGDGSPHASSPSPTHTYSAAGTYSARVTVDDGRGRTASRAIAIFPGDTPPAASISTPVGGQTYRDGERVRLQGSAADAEDGALHGAALDWHVRLHHGSHVHDLGSFTGGAAAFTAGTDHDSDSFYEVTLVATDSAGATDLASVVVRPETVGLRLDSSPPGAPLSYSGLAVTAPFETRPAIGFVTSISAAEHFASAGREYEFAGWSDGGAALHDLRIPAGDTTITALYRELAPNPAPDPFGAVLGNGLLDRTGPTLRITVPASSSVRRPVKRIEVRVHDPSGVASVEVAIRRTSVCRWWSARLRRLVRRSSRCARPHWVRASQLRGRSGSWRVSLGHALPRGSYFLFFKAQDRDGNVSRRLADGRQRLRLAVSRPR